MQCPFLTQALRKILIHNNSMFHKHTEHQRLARQGHLQGLCRSFSLVSSNNTSLTNCLLRSSSSLINNTNSTYSRILKGWHGSIPNHKHKNNTTTQLPFTRLVISMNPSVEILPKNNMTMITSSQSNLTHK